jgi:hypothetical protein
MDREAIVPRPAAGSGFDLEVTLTERSLRVHGRELTRS